MSIKIDLRNQIRQTKLPKWKPLLPLFEAVMNSFQAIRDNRPHTSSRGSIEIEIERESSLFADEEASVVGFRITDSGIGLTDENFDSFNTAFSSYKVSRGGKGLGRFTWLKAFNKAYLTSTFADGAATKYLRRSFYFDENYDLDERGLPTSTDSTKSETTVRLVDFHEIYKAECPKSTEVIVDKLIEHFILIFLEPDCPSVVVKDRGEAFHLNEIFERDYRSNASMHRFVVRDLEFVMHGFRLPTSRPTKHKLVYAADQRGVVSDNLEDYLPNLASRLIGDDGSSFFYLAIVQGNYLSEHVSPGRMEFDFDPVEDVDAQSDIFVGSTIRRSDIRNSALPLIQTDLASIIASINADKLERIKSFVSTEAPQYKILIKYADQFIDKMPPVPKKSEIETALHRELYQREVKMKQDGSRIIREADKVDIYEEYQERLSTFMEQYNELGVSALAQYVAHRKIMLEFLARAISIPEGERKYPLERVVHQLVFPMRHTTDDTLYAHQNLWMIDERLTYHSFVSSDNPLHSFEMLETKSEKRGDIVIFDEKMIFGDAPADQHPINSITTIEFKRPGRDDYTDKDNPIRQAFRLIEDIRSGRFKIKGRPISLANERVPAVSYCVCDVTDTLRQILKDFDAQITPDGQGYYGFNRSYGVYFEVIDYDKLLRDAKKRNRIFFDKLNLVRDFS